MNNLTETVRGHFENEDYVFFWNGVFSNWHLETFEIADAKFNCAEQAMMVSKAIYFEDSDAAVRIMKSNEPREQKAIGRTIQNYDDEKWSTVRLYFVTKILIHKFEDLKLRKILLDTGNKTIVEASPVDAIWGIKMGIGHADVLDQTKWKGENLLGIALMAVRDFYNRENKS